ncbi:acylphosphatase [Pleionea sediminis]|uniref:acylphosphatase n=1 Tax=Pleionea sediminis TaxID=2569479 RepID=UPI00118509B0|nr:acylphosphatase [Pleionea sediminis]
MTEPNKRVHAYISGVVQGVWYRASTQEKATQLGLNGWVRNLSDGRVELIAEGDAMLLQQLMQWCQRGPENASVEDINVSWCESKDEFESFETRPTE